MTGGTLGVIGGTLVGSGGGGGSNGYRTAVLADSPLVFWELNDLFLSQTVAADQSGSARNGTYVGPSGAGVGFQPGPLANDLPQAMFTSSGFVTRVDIADNAAWDTTTLSLEAWVYPFTVAAGQGNIIGRDANSGAGTRVFQFRRSGTSLELVAFMSTTARTTTATSVFTVNTWYHVAATVSGATAKLFVNGVEVQSATTSGTLDSGTVGFAVGSRNATAHTDSWQGRLAGAAYYNTALVEADFAAHYAAGS